MTLSRQRKYQLAKRKQGLCARCGSQPISERSRNHCAACLDRDIDRQRERYPERRDALIKRFRKRYHNRMHKGICTRCGKRKCGITMMCELCRKHELDQRARRYAELHPVVRRQRLYHFNEET